MPFIYYNGILFFVKSGKKVDGESFLIDNIVMTAIHVCFHLGDTAESADLKLFVDIVV